MIFSYGINVMKQHIMTGTEVLLNFKINSSLEQGYFVLTSFNISSSQHHTVKFETIGKKKIDTSTVRTNLVTTF
jgi:hypothetical protein